jgi:hypothetical protein
MRIATALLLAGLGCGTGWTKTQTTLVYDLSAGGLGAAEFYVTVQLDQAAYRIDASGSTYGAADLMGSLVVNAFSTGIVGSDAVAPSSFGTDNIYDSAARRTRVTWSGTEALAQEIVPSLADEERTPIPDDARQGALDPIAALMSFALGGPARGACSGSAKVYDGRRSYELFLDAVEAGIVEQLEVGDTSVAALKCRITSVRTGGKSPDGWLSSSGDSEHAEIWFLQDGSGQALPLRVEADAPIGYAVAQLTRLP